MSASIIQKKAGFATVTGSGSVSVTLDSPISAGSLLVIAAALVQSNGSVGSTLSPLVEDNFTNSYGPFVATSSGQGFFADPYIGSITPVTGAQSYALNFTALSGQSADTFLAGLCLYELSGTDNNSPLHASQSLSDGVHKIV